MKHTSRPKDYLSEHAASTSFFHHVRRLEYALIMLSSSPP